MCLGSPYWFDANCDAIICVPRGILIGWVRARGSAAHALHVSSTTSGARGIFVLFFNMKTAHLILLFVLLFVWGVNKAVGIPYKEERGRTGTRPKKIETGSNSYMRRGVARGASRGLTHSPRAGIQAK